MTVSRPHPLHTWWELMLKPVWEGTSRNPTGAPSASSRVTGEGKCRPGTRVPPWETKGLSPVNWRS